MAFNLVIVCSHLKMRITFQGFKRLHMFAITVEDQYSDVFLFCFEHGKSRTVGVWDLPSSEIVGEQGEHQTKQVLAKYLFVLSICKSHESPSKMAQKRKIHTDIELYSAMI